MRGARRQCNKLAGCCGIIPAYAGSTLAPTCAAPCAWDHPRVCGEHPSVSHGVFKAEGSSPRMRGARYDHPTPRPLHRIIPAYAGSTCWNEYTPITSRDHPRVCGEHTEKATRHYYAEGSSPRMRGALKRQFLAPEAPGIIPAYAGSTTRKKSRL